MPAFGKGGKVDLRQGVGEKFPKLRVALSSPPAIYKNLAITGEHSQESPSLGPSGDVRAWDLRTGKLVWTFHTIPQPGEPNHDAWKDDQWVDRAGANAWGFITVDEERGIAYVPIGTPATDFYGGDRQGSNLYGSSLVALDADNRQVEVVFPDHASRQLGLRSDGAAGLDRCQAQRPDDSRRRAVHQAGPAVHLRSRHRQADIRRRRTAGRVRQSDSRATSTGRHSRFRSSLRRSRA